MSSGQSDKAAEGSEPSKNTTQQIKGGGTAVQIPT